MNSVGHLDAEKLDTLGLFYVFIIRFPASLFLLLPRLFKCLLLFGPVIVDSGETCDHCRPGLRV